MLDSAGPTGPQDIIHQRSRGAASVRLDAPRPGTVRPRLAGLRQSGCAKAFLPRVHVPVPEVVFLNTAGGLTGGDRLDYTLDVAAGVQVAATTQTAERVYASLGPVAEVDVRITAGPGAQVIWCPQETILFERAALSRRTEVDLTGDSSLLMAETLVLGRTAMGETLSALDVTDRRRVRRDGRPVLEEPLRLTARALAAQGTSGLDGALAVATLCLIAPGAEDRLAGLRAILPRPDSPDGALRCAASGWDGKLVLRAAARDALALRRLVGQALIHLSGAALPRVWQL